MKKFLETIKAHQKIIFPSIAAGAILIILGARACSNKSDKNVSYEPLKKTTMVEGVYGIGTITARNTYQLKLGVTSAVRKLFVAEGDSVKRGQRLVEFEGTGTFTAPFDGTITFISSKVGESVFAGAVVLSLVDLIDRYLVVSLEQRAAVRVRPNQNARISFENMREVSYEGTVQSVYSNENNFLVRIGVTNLPTQLLPGMTADVAISIGEHKGVFVVPTNAIESGKTIHIKRKDSGKLELISIKTGIVDGASAEVQSSELVEGDLLVVKRKPGA